MNTDRELLEAAAKAIGINGRYVDVYDGGYYYNGNTSGILYELPSGQIYVWNPLTDDGDALRLAVVLQMELKVYEVSAHAASAIGGCSACTSEKGDPYAATRRAIVRVAAEIGRNKT